MFGLKERHVAGNPKQNRLRQVTAFFLWRKVGLMSSGAAGLEDGIKDTCSLEVRGGGVFYFKTYAKRSFEQREMRIIVNSRINI